MKIEFGKALDNKTWRFLMPCLRGYGDIFVNKFNNEIFKLAYGISDTLIQGTKILEGKRPIFIMIDTAVLPRQTANFMDWVKYQPYYITDYAADINNPRLHMLVLEAPEEFYVAYDKFCVGLYSEMYTDRQLENLFGDKRDTEQYQILSRDPRYSNIFLKKVEDEFSVRMKGIDKQIFISTAEYEFPYSLDSEHEIFNT